ncbi:MAG: enoyl-[acyl-carrier-protein] reductase FabK [Peptococcaceae bacterium]|jgi:enoyl-[acyl-carrier protein] reductase II|nr:enoyl-[acyl-carrier-protein] reductase FabK [Peptococcaceae bacterium]
MNKFDFFHKLGVKYPLIQGGMAWISDSSLASAVSEAGGIGMLAAGSAPVEYVQQEIRKAKQLTAKPFGVNIMLLSEHVEAIARLVCAEGIKIVTTGAGSPGKYLKMWKEHGITVIPVVPSVALARRMEKEGADAVIAEGGEAGGHIGELTTMALLPQIVDAVDIPVIAAGGIGDGRGIAAAFMLGASGVQMGTRFLVAKECTVHQNYKERIIKARDIDSVVTGRSTGHPVRVLRNKLTRRFEELERAGASIEELEALGTGALRKAAKDGDVANGSVMAGQIAGLVKEEQSCSEIIEQVFSEAAERLNALSIDLIVKDNPADERD